MWTQLKKILPKHQAINIVGPMEVEQSMIDKELLTFWVDGGLNHGIKCKNCYWIGDGDSLNGAHPEKQGHLLSRDKDISDLGQLLHKLLEMPLKHQLKIYAYGLLKGRDDHFLANIGEIMHFLKHCGQSCAYLHIHHSKAAEKVYCYPSGTHKMMLHGPFTLLSLYPVELNLSGQCDYQLKEKTDLYPLSSQGLSNNAHGEITISCDQPVMILSY